MWRNTVSTDIRIAIAKIAKRKPEQGSARGAGQLQAAFRNQNATIHSGRAPQYAGHAGRFAMLAVWHSFAGWYSERWQVSEMWIRIALVQAMHLLRSWQPIRVHAAGQRAHSEKRYTQQLRVVEIRVTREKGNLDSGSLRPNDARRRFENLFKK